MSKAYVPRVWWIPVYADLLTHRNLLRLKRELKVTRPHAVGLMTAAYLWLANEITENHQDGLDAVLELEDAPIVIDGEVDFDGYFQAMCKVGWFVWDAEHAALRVVRYFEKNGAQALKRARDQNSKVHQRRRGEEPQGDRPSDEESGRVADTTRTPRGHDADTTLTPDGRDADQQEQEQEEPKHHQHIPGTSVRTGDDGAGGGGALGKGIDPDGSEGRELVQVLVGQGVREAVAKATVLKHPPMVVACAVQMGVEAKRNGWAGNVAGHIINRIKDGSAADAVDKKSVDDAAVAAREWARSALAQHAALRAGLSDEARRREPKLALWTDHQVCTILPPMALVVLAERLAAMVERGDFIERDVPVAFTAHVAKVSSVAKVGAGGSGA